MKLIGNSASSASECQTTQASEQVFDTIKDSVIKSGACKVMVDLIISDIPFTL